MTETEPRRRNVKSASLMPNESAIKDKIMKYLKGLPRCYALKVWGNHTTIGQPDILACHNGRMLALEVKRPGEQPTEIQKSTLKKWADAGAVAGVVRSVADVNFAIMIHDCEWTFSTQNWVDFERERIALCGNG